MIEEIRKLQINSWLHDKNKAHVPAISAELRMPSKSD
jgi:hypothetical protein